MLREVWKYRVPSYLVIVKLNSRIYINSEYDIIWAVAFCIIGDIMNTIANIFKQAREAGSQPVSFEIFPPKGEMNVDAAREVVSQLSQLAPDFISVTYSAGGSGNKRATSDIASMIQGEFDVPSIAHLTCAGASKESIAAAVDDMKGKGIANVLALRGDLPEGCELSDFRFAKDLIPVLADAGFCVGAAAYPEGHIDCDSLRLNVEHLKQKQDAGASFFVSQLFFDNDCFYRFREDAERAGVTLPITAGIMPFMSKQQIQRMVFMCGASLPSPIIKLLARFEGDPQSLRQAGIEYACRQLTDLQEHGVDGLHVYTMNKPEVARAAACALKVALVR